MSTEIRTLCFVLAIVLAGLYAFRLCLAPGPRRALGPHLFVYVGLLYAVAFLSPDINILRAFLVLAPVFTVRDRTEAAGLYLLSLPLVPLLAIEEKLGSMYLLNVTTAQMMALGLALAVLAKPGRMRPVPLRYDLLFWAMILVTVAAGARGGPAIGYLRLLVDLSLSFGLPFYFLSRVLTTGEQTERALIPFMASGFALSFFALFEVRRNWALFQELYFHYDIPLSASNVILRMRGGLFRSHGPFVESTSFGLYLCVALLAIMAYQTVFRSRPRGALAAALTGLGLVLTQARGDWLGAIGGIILLYVFRGKAAQLWATAILGSITGGLVYLAALTSHRLAESIGLRSDATGDYRRQLFDEGMKQVRQHPLLGQAPGRVEAAMSQLTQGEHIVDFVNSHLFVALTSGIPGLLIWLGFLLVGPIDLWSRRRPALRGGRNAPAASLTFASLAALTLALTFTSTYERNVHWAVIMAAVGAATAARPRRDAQPQPASKDAEADRQGTEPSPARFHAVAVRS